MNRSTLKSIGAVLAGILAIFVLSNTTDAVLHGTGVFPPLGRPMDDAHFLLATAQRNSASLSKLLLRNT